MPGAASKTPPTPGIQQDAGPNSGAAASLARAVAAAGPQAWTLKGEGNANIVMAYTGPDPLLVSMMVVCVRSSC